MLELEHYMYLATLLAKVQSSESGPPETSSGTCMAKLLGCIDEQCKSSVRHNPATAVAVDRDPPALKVPPLFSRGHHF